MDPCDSWFWLWGIIIYRTTLHWICMIYPTRNALVALCFVLLWLYLYHPFLMDSYHLFHSLVPGKFNSNFKSIIFPDSDVGWPDVGLTSVLSSRGWANVSRTFIAVWVGTHCEIALSWMPQDLPNDRKSTLVQVMAWCYQATSHYLS